VTVFRVGADERVVSVAAIPEDEEPDGADGDGGDGAGGN
jgi:DNA gyrase subunit A